MPSNLIPLIRDRSLGGTTLVYICAHRLIYTLDSPLTPALRCASNAQRLLAQGSKAGSETRHQRPLSIWSSLWKARVAPYYSSSSLFDFSAHPFVKSRPRSPAS